MASVREELVGKEGTQSYSTSPIANTDAASASDMHTDAFGPEHGNGQPLHVRAVSASKKRSSIARNVRTTSVLGIGRSYSNSN